MSLVSLMKWWAFTVGDYWLAKVNHTFMEEEPCVDLSPWKEPCPFLMGSQGVAL